MVREDRLGAVPVDEPHQGPAVVVTVVHAPACHFCEDAQVALRELAGQYRLRVELVEAASPEGERLLRDHATPMFPLVLVDGLFFSHGRLPRRKLRRLLENRAALGAVGG